MLTKLQKTFVIVAGIVAMLVFGLRPAIAGTGIWKYNADFWVTVVNLTDYKLTYVKEGASGAHNYPECWGAGCYRAMLDEGVSSWEIDPFRTKVWVCYLVRTVDPIAYNGRITLYSEGFEDWKFDVAFVGQHAHNLVESGTWTALSPAQAGQGWAAANTFSTGRWATPVDDNKMHNVMTLISPEIMVTVFSGDNVGITIVVQQLRGYDAAGYKIWDDSNVGYIGWQLDFVDNGSSSVP